MDEKSQELWDQYTIAKYSMLLASNTPFCPWTIIVSDSKKQARINLFRYILANVEYPKKIDAKNFECDEGIVRSGEEEIRQMEANLKNEKLSKMNG